MSCSNSDILALIDYFENGTDLSNNDWDNYNYYDLWNALENGASPPSRTVCATFTQADILSVTLAVLGDFTTPSEYLGFNRDFYYLYLKAIGQEFLSPVFTNSCIYDLYQVFTVGGGGFVGLLDDYPNASAAYSIRKLRNDYAGGLIEMMRDSPDSSIVDVMPDANNEISLDSPVIVTAGASFAVNLGQFVNAELYSNPDGLPSPASGFVRTWYDQSGNGFNQIQTSASIQPQIINSGAIYTENGKPILRRTVQNASLLSTLNPNLISNSTFFYAGKDYGNYNEITLIGAGTPSTNTGLFFAQSGSTNTTIHVQATVSNERLNGATHTYTNRGDLYTDFQNHILQSFNAANFTFQQNNLALGYNSGGATFGYAMLSSQEVIIYDSDQSSNVAGIESNINNYFSIY